MGSVGDGLDVLILGAGMFGTSTAYHLALTHHDPSRIAVLDRAPVPSPQAASSDINKIVRADYSKPFYMDLAYEAIEGWLNTDWLLPYFHQTGWIMLDERKSDLGERIRKNFKQSGRPDTSKEITIDEVKRSWGGVLSGVDASNHDKAYTNSSAGWADASGAVHAMADEAIKKGVRYLVGEATDLLHDGDRLSGVKTQDGKTYTAEKILLATGAWTPWLMTPLETSLSIARHQSIAEQIRSAGVCVAAFRLSDDEAKYYNQMPIFIYGGKGEVMPPNKDRLFKFTNAGTFLNTEKHPCGRDISVPTSDQHSVPPGLKAESIEIIRERIPRILEHGRVPDEWRLCWDAISPDQNQLISQHPDPRLSNLYFATAGSFHSWKFLPNIGKYVVNVLNGKSNGDERDAAWTWKTSWSERGAHEKVMPRGELRDLA